MYAGVMGAKNTAVGYARVSTEGQAAEGVSMEAQAARIRAWCQANEHELIALHADAGLSGGRADNRPELQRALDAVCATGSVLIVYSLSRLARSTKDTITIAERLEAADADLVSLSERIDTTSAAGRMIFRMLAVLSEFERDLVSERTTAALAHKRIKCERVGTVPYGFDLAPDGVHLLNNLREQDVIQTIRSLRGGGMTYRAIAAHLNAVAVSSKTGGRWYPQAVANICTRPVCERASQNITS